MVATTEWASPEGLTAISTVVTAIATIATAFGVLFVWKQIVCDHDRSRRENAVDLLSEWTTGLQESSTLVRKFVEELNEDQCKKLAAQATFDVPSDKRDILVACLSGVTEEASVKPSASGKITLTEKESAHIRWLVTTYLNRLECVLTA
jgi:hypothetical protein